MSSKLLRFALLALLAALVAVPIAGAALVASAGTADKGARSAKNDNRLISLDVKKKALLEKALQKKLKRQGLRQGRRGRARPVRPARARGRGRRLDGAR